MWELWVALMVVGARVLAAGSAGFVGSFLVQRLRDRQTAKRVAKDLVNPSGVERPVTAEPGVVPASNPALVLVRASGFLREAAAAAGGSARLGAEDLAWVTRYRGCVGKKW